MWLYMWVPHPAQPVPLFEDIALAFGTGTPALRAMIVVAALGIAGFSVLNIRSLIWNLGQLQRYRGTEAHRKLITSNAETQLTALPLALAMTVNVGFILGMVFVPGLWSVVEYLFPVAMLAFAAIGGLALVQIGRFLARATQRAGLTGPRTIPSPRCSPPSRLPWPVWACRLLRHCRAFRRWRRYRSFWRTPS